MTFNNVKRVGKLAIVVTIFGGIVYYALPTSTTTYEADVQEVEPVQEQVDALEQSKAELARINAQLDDEEARLLAEQIALEEEYEAKQAAIQERLDAILETRMSFSSAPARNE